MFYQTPDDGSADRTGNQLCYTTINYVINYVHVNF